MKTEKFIKYSFLVLFIMSFFVHKDPHTSLAVVEALIGAAGNLLGGLFGSLFSGADQEKANNLLQEAFDQINKVGAPPDLAKEIIYNKFNQAGLYTPQLENAIEQNYSELATLKDSTQGRDAQLAALKQLQDRGMVGVTAEERASMNDVRDQAQRDLKSKNAQLLQNLQTRGMAGSGAELAATLGNSQASTQTEAEQSDRVAAEANKRALNAIMASGEMGSNIRNQDVSINTTRAKAQDELNRFNINNKEAINQRNTNALNNAQRMNLAEKQKVQDTNTALSNQELLRQRNAENQTWQERLAYAKDKSGALKDQADSYAKRAQDTRNTVGGIGKSASDIAGSIYSNQNALPQPDNSTPSRLDIDNDEEKKKKIVDTSTPGSYYA